MRKIFFTSDQHFGDDRFSILFRPFNNLKDMHTSLIDSWNSVVEPDDIVYHIGDFAVTDDALKYIKYLNGEIHLIKGNYDDPRDEELLLKYFKTVQDEMTIKIDGNLIHINHYPEQASPDAFNIVGHVHGAWRVQRNMINVSCDAWHWRPVSMDEIKLGITAIKKFYDANIFAGELEVNKIHSSIREVYAEEKINTEDFKVFLAGPTPRDRHTRSWRPSMISALNEAGFKGSVYIPEKREKIEEFSYIEQVEWEEWALERADLIIFWVPRELSKMPAFTTNIEFGEWMKSGKVVLGYPESAVKMKYMRHKAEVNKIPVYNTMDALADRVVKISNTQ